MNKSPGLERGVAQEIGSAIASERDDTVRPQVPARMDFRERELSRAAWKRSAQMLHDRMRRPGIQQS